MELIFKVADECLFVVDVVRRLFNVFNGVVELFEDGVALTCGLVVVVFIVLRLY